MGKHIVPPLRTFIQENDLKGEHFAAFACQAGNGAEKAFKKLSAVLGVEELEKMLILIEPKAKQNPENDRKIQEFCQNWKS